MKKILFLLLTFHVCLAWGQTNILSVNPVAEEIMLGNYNPADYQPSLSISHPDDLVNAVLNGISTDSLKAYLLALRTFQNRNTGSDTISNVKGIGAARRWVYEKFKQIGQENEGRLVPSYLQFDQVICAVGQHRNVFAVLPGTDTSAHGVILVEAHLDSRCDVLCDTSCLAEGMEDNGSGTALVIELARVMSKFDLKRSVVFMATTAEEQGLLGAEAFAIYAKNKGIPIVAVLNNDVIGGIVCGETSSPPSCPGFNHIDSTQVRLFSNGGFNSKHKQLARFIKLQYEEEAKSLVPVPMQVTIMSAEDRTGRGGDHIPFRERGFAAMRFTSANEHGNADVTSPNYHDRQHTSDDILGVDTDADNVIDSFFVDFNYLSRNAAINGVAAALAAIGPVTPDFTAGKFGDSIRVEIIDSLGYGEYRVFQRTDANDFDTIYTTNQLSITFLKRGVVNNAISVASVDENGIESLFSKEVFPSAINRTDEAAAPPPPFQLLQNRPNPFDEATIIAFIANEALPLREGFIVVADVQGKEIKRLPVAIRPGMNEVVYTHGYNVTGVFSYSLEVGGKVVETKRMVFAN